MPHTDRVPEPVLDDILRSGGDLRVGSFRFWFVGQRWEWSDEVARMHGYEPGTVTPTTELLLAHKHPDDRRHVQELLDQALHSGGAFSSRHRFIDTNEREHTVLVLADRMLDDSGAVVGTEGYYVDLTANVPLNVWGLTLNAHVGYQGVRHFGDASYTDWKIGVTKDLGNGFALAVAYLDTNASRTAYTNTRGRYLGKATAFASITKTF